MKKLNKKTAQKEAQVNESKCDFLTEKKLLKVIKLIKDQGDKTDKFCKIGLEISDINENLYMATDTLLDSFFNKEKTETLYWFIYENPSLPCIYATDGRTVLYDFRKKGDLWRYLISLPYPNQLND